MQGVLSMVAVAWAQPTEGAEALELATRLVDEIGPRPTGSDGSKRALDWVETELAQRGWTPERWIGRRRDGAEDGVLACAGDGPVVLFLAHVDSVHSRVPGANDNAAAVGALLELATRLSPDGGAMRRVCLAFPDGEEIGLVGSRFLRDDGRLGDVDQVVALDLVGRGTVTHNGLGPAWSAEDVRALLDAAPADVPWVYRAISHAAPQMERSDHGPWGLHGIPASHVMARGESGVYWAYHTTDDTPSQLDVGTLGEVVGVLEGIADAPPLGSEQVSGEPWFVVPWTGRWAGVLGGGWVVGGAGTLVLLVLGVLGGLVLPLVGFRVGSDPDAAETPKRTLRGWAVEGAWDLGRVAAPLVVGAVVLGVASLGRSFAADRALPVVLATWFAFLSATLAIRPQKTPIPGLVVGGIGGVIVGILVLPAPLLALPGALALAGMGWTVAVRGPSLRSRLFCLPGALIAAWPALYLVRPAAIREVAFHGLLPAHAVVWAPAWLVLALPVAVAWASVVQAPSKHRGIAAGIALLAGLCVVWALFSPPASGVLDVPPMFFPASFHR